MLPCPGGLVACPEIERLLTEPYFSQHHLRWDAWDRAIMTTTCLTLTAEQATSEPDRAITSMLFFRATSDALVKEDGGLDPNLASALPRTWLADLQTRLEMATGSRARLPI